MSPKIFYWIRVSKDFKCQLKYFIATDEEQFSAEKRIRSSFLLYKNKKLLEKWETITSTPSIYPKMYVRNLCFQENEEKQLFCLLMGLYRIPYRAYTCLKTRFDPLEGDFECSPKSFISTAEE